MTQIFRSSAYAIALLASFAVGGAVVLYPTAATARPSLTDLQQQIDDQEAEIESLKLGVSGNRLAALRSQLVFWCDWTVPNPTSATEPRDEISNDTVSLPTVVSIENSDPVNATLDDYLLIDPPGGDTFIVWSFPPVPAYSVLGYTVATWSWTSESGGQQTFMLLEGDAGGRLGIRFNQSHSYKIQHTTSQPDTGVTGVTNTWVHLAATIDKDGDWVFYKNGAVVASGAGSPISDSALNLLLISSPANGETRADQTGMWNRILSPAEIELLYNGGVGLQFSDL